MKRKLTRNSVKRKSRMLLLESQNILPCSALEFSHCLIVQRSCKVTRLRYLDALVHPSKLGTHRVGIPLIITCIHPTQENINIDFKKAQTVSGLNKILITISAILVCSNQTRDLLNALLRDTLLAQIAANNACGAFTMGYVVDGIVYPIFWIK